MNSYLCFYHQYVICSQNHTFWCCGGLYVQQVTTWMCNIARKVRWVLLARRQAGCRCKVWFSSNLGLDVHAKSFVTPYANWGKIFVKNWKGKLYGKIALRHGQWKWSMRWSQNWNVRDLIRWMRGFKPGFHYPNSRPELTARELG